MVGITGGLRPLEAEAIQQRFPDPFPWRAGIAGLVQLAKVAFDFAGPLAGLQPAVAACGHRRRSHREGRHSQDPHRAEAKAAGVACVGRCGGLSGGCRRRSGVGLDRRHADAQSQAQRQGHQQGEGPPAQTTQCRRQPVAGGPLGLEGSRHRGGFGGSPP